MGRRLFIILLLSAVLPVWGIPPASYKTETTGACSDSSVAEGLRRALQPKGVRLVDDKGATVGEVWLRSNLPLKAGASAANYSALPEGTLVGVLHFSDKSADFRGQSIKAGFYTLRYAQILQDGNHQGAAPYPDFLLLAPAAADKDLDAQLKFDALVKLSRQASGANHPAVFMLLPPTASTDALQHSDQGYWAVVSKTQAKSTSSDKATDFPFAIVLVGKAE
jgi:hypothetical protein